MSATFVPPDGRSPDGGLRELAAMLLAGTTPDRLAGDVAAVAARSLPGCDAASITVIREGVPTTAGASADVARDVDDAQYEAHEGPCLTAIETASIVRVDRVGDDHRWPRFAAEALRRGIDSSLSVPLTVAGHVVAGLNLYSRRPSGFAGCERSAALFAARAAVTWSNHGALHEAEDVTRRLAEAIEHRDVIGQAKGVLVGTRGLSPEEAFDVLRRASHESGRKLYDVARELVERRDLPPSRAT